MNLRSLLLILAISLPVRAGGRPPNVVFILADDLGYGEIGTFGEKLIATPNLDRMAAEGMKFTRFYAGSTVCAPSRSVLMTGLHTGHTRVRGNGGKARPLAQQIQPEDLTVAEVLKGKGYSTALIGKWGLGEEGSEGIPNRQGFDYFYGYLNQHHAHNPYPPFLLRDGERVKLRNETDPASVSAEAAAAGAGIAREPLDYAPDLMAEEALKWVEWNRSGPFFLFWSLITPHANNEGSKAGRGQEVPDAGDYKEKPWPQADRNHAATIARLDADVGRLLALLKKLEIDEDTLVIFTSDNGPHREGGNNPELFDANGPFRGLKRDLTDGGIRVPMIARWPGKAPAGKTVDGVFWFADILPTFAGLAGASVPEGDGMSFSPLLLNAPWEQPVRKPLYWEFHEGGFSQAVLMDERWKAIRLKRRDAPVRVYDTKEDPGEKRDLSGERPELVSRAKEYFESSRTESVQWPMVDAPAE